MRVLSLGWGVQSWTLAALSALGTLPKLDYAVHADTGWEKAATYAFAAEWGPWLEERGISVITVRSELAGGVEDRWGSILIPAYTTYLDGRASGRLHRQCTYKWKTAPVRRCLQDNRDGETVELWFGFTLDEIRRTCLDSPRYVRNRFPFIEDLDPAWRRGKCIQWLESQNLGVPPRSSCVCCPFQSRREWRENQRDRENWLRALEVDREIRDRREGYRCYLTSELRPLGLCDFSSQEDHGQLRLLGTEKSRAW